MPHQHDVDWKKLYERLERAKVEADRWVSPDPERSRSILDERARELAQRPSATFAPAEEVAELMFFTAGREHFAIGLAWAIAVARIGAIEPVPDAPLVFRGIANHRGKALAVIDLGALLSGTPTDSASTYVLVLGLRRPEIAVAVDLVDEVTRVPVTRIDRTTMPAWRDRAKFASGLIDGRRLVLDGQLLLEDPRLTAARVTT